jgi:hypothetical protein
LEKLKGVFKSRKFWAAIAGLVVVMVKGLDPNFPLSEDQVTLVIGTLGAYILGTALERPSPGPDRALQGDEASRPPAA